MQDIYVGSVSIIGRKVIWAYQYNLLHLSSAWIQTTLVLAISWKMMSSIISLISYSSDSEEKASKSIFAKEIGYIDLCELYWCSFILPAKRMSSDELSHKGTFLDIVWPGVVIATIPMPWKIPCPSSVLGLWSTLSPTYWMNCSSVVIFGSIITDAALFSNFWTWT